MEPDRRDPQRCGHGQESINAELKAWNASSNRYLALGGLILDTRRNRACQ
jgi:hypothetical protein